MTASFNINVPKHIHLSDNKIISGIKALADHYSGEKDFDCSYVSDKDIELTISYKLNKPFLILTYSPESLRLVGYVSAWSDGAVVKDHFMGLPLEDFALILRPHFDAGGFYKIFSTDLSVYIESFEENFNQFIFPKNYKWYKTVFQENREVIYEKIYQCIQNLQLLRQPIDVFDEWIKETVYNEKMEVFLPIIEEENPGFTQALQNLHAEAVKGLHKRNVTKLETHLSLLNEIYNTSILTKCVENHLQWVEKNVTVVSQMMTNVDHEFIWPENMNLTFRNLIMKEVMLNSKTSPHKES